MQRRICKLLGLDEHAFQTETNGNYVISQGDTVPTAGTAGYAIGGDFLHRDGEAGTSRYINEGSESACDFRPVLTGEGDVFFYGAIEGTYVEWDHDENSYGRFKVVNASTRLTLNRSINECGLCMTQTHDTDATTSQSQGGNAIYGWYKLPAENVNESESGLAMMAAVKGRMELEGTLNGDQVQAIGTFGEIAGTPAALTECDFIAAVYAKNLCATAPGTGDFCLFLGQNWDATMEYGLKLEAVSGIITNGVNFTGTVTNALDFAEGDGSQGATEGTGSGTTNVTCDAKVQIDIGGNTYYFAAYNGTVTLTT